MKLIATAGVIAALALAACGSGSSDEEQIRAATQDFTYAMADGDGAAACATMTADEQQHFADTPTESDCATAVEDFAKYTQGKIDWDSLQVDRVDVNGDTATVGFDGDSSTLQFTKGDSGWQMSGGL